MSGINEDAAEREAILAELEYPAAIVRDCAPSQTTAQLREALADKREELARYAAMGIVDLKDGPGY